MANYQTGEDALTNRRNKLIAVQFYALRESFGGKCSAYGCDAISGLEFAHLEETPLSGWGRGRKERYYDIINHRESYRLMCDHHHRLYDKGVDVDSEDTRQAEETGN